MPKIARWSSPDNPIFFDTVKSYSDAPRLLSLIARRAGHRSSLNDALLVPKDAASLPIKSAFLQVSPPLLRNSGKLMNTPPSFLESVTAAIAWVGNDEPQYQDLKARLVNFVARYESESHMAPEISSKPLLLIAD